MLLGQVEITIYLQEMQIHTRLRLDFEGDNEFEREGEWSASDPTSKKLADLYFGETDGYWTVYRGGRGSNMVVLYDRPPDTGLSVLWRSSPDNVANLFFTAKGFGADRILSKIFNLGMEDSGSQVSPPMNSFRWKVIKV